MAVAAAVRVGGEEGSGCQGEIVPVLSLWTRMRRPADRRALIYRAASSAASACDSV